MSIILNQEAYLLVFWCIIGSRSLKMGLLGAFLCILLEVRNLSNGIISILVKLLMRGRIGFSLEPLISLQIIIFGSNFIFLFVVGHLRLVWLILGPSLRFLGCIFVKNQSLLCLFLHLPIMF
jgi:hypothetical protein